MQLSPNSPQKGLLPSGCEPFSSAPPELLHADHSDGQGEPLYASVNSCSSTLLGGSFLVFLPFVTASAGWSHFSHTVGHCLPGAPRHPIDQRVGVKCGRVVPTMSVFDGPFLRPLFVCLVFRNPSLPCDDKAVNWSTKRDATSRLAVVFDNRSLLVPADVGTFALNRSSGRAPGLGERLKRAHSARKRRTLKSLTLICSRIRGLKLWFSVTGFTRRAAWHSHGKAVSCR